MFWTRCSCNTCVCERPFIKELQWSRRDVTSATTSISQAFFGEKQSDSSNISNVEVTGFNNVVNMFSKRQCAVKNYAQRPYVRRYVYVSQVPRQRRCHIATRRLFRSKYDELRFFWIKFQHIASHPWLQLVNTFVYRTQQLPTWPFSPQATSNNCITQFIRLKWDKDTCS